MLSSNCATKISYLNKTINIISSRNGHIMRGKRPGIAKSLEQRIAEDKKKVDPNPLQRVNIGFENKNSSRALVLKNRVEHLKKMRNDPTMEKLARKQNINVDLEQVRKDSQNTALPIIFKKVADHYGIYEDLFDNAYFVPRINMDVHFIDEKNQNFYVHCGNILNAASCINEPKIKFNHEKELLEKSVNSTETYWSILMVNPDTHLFFEQHETCINWFISNIINGELKSGEEIVTYLQPFPVKGLGYQRNVFVLFKQTKRMDFGDLKLNSENLKDRKFNLLEFYRKYQSDITPAGLSFFQTQWDESVTDFFRKKNLVEPTFAYDFPKPYLADQKWFPLKQPFNSYLDKHRQDSSKINKSYLKPYLFKDLNIPIKYPMAHPIKGVPSWMISEIKKERLKLVKQMENKAKI